MLSQTWVERPRTAKASSASNGWARARKTKVITSTTSPILLPLPAHPVKVVKLLLVGKVALSSTRHGWERSRTDGGLTWVHASGKTSRFHGAEFGETCGEAHCVMGKTCSLEVRNGVNVSVGGRSFLFLLPTNLFKRAPTQELASTFDRYLPCTLLRVQSSHVLGGFVTGYHPVQNDYRRDVVQIFFG